MILPVGSHVGVAWEERYRRRALTRSSHPALAHSWAAWQLAVGLLRLVVVVLWECLSLVGVAIADLET